MQFIPARGRKRVFDGFHVDFHNIAIYPREGTETVDTEYAGDRCQLQFIPARGRKPGCSKITRRTFNCNLSPRGDGNKDNRAVNRNHIIAIYPREGTETRRVCLIKISINCNLSPRGDGNMKLYSPALTLDTIAIYPREGTETDKFIQKISSANCNLSPRGDGNCQDEGSQSAAGAHCNLSPRGDGNFILFCGLCAHGDIAIYPREGTETRP